MNVRIGILSSAALCVIAMAVFAYKSEKKPESRPRPGATADSNRSTSDKGEKGPVRMVRFTLFDTGIYPHEVKVEAGLVNLAMEDKSGNASGLVVERITGNERSRVGEVGKSVNHVRGRQVLKLTPGEYRVFDQSRPQYQALLLVQPN